MTFQDINRQEGCVDDLVGDGVGLGGGIRSFRARNFKKSAGSDLMKKSELAKKGRLPIRSLN